MSKEYPFFPELPEAAAIEAQELLNRFKEEMRKVGNEVISDFYCDVMPYIESDTWTNFRNELLDGFRDYDNSKIQGKYDFTQIRQAIYKAHKDEIVKDLNQDMIKEIASLNEQLEFQRSIRY